ncbi:hypothetical protein JCM10213v2_001129 [Rhodosporidiobolus nylandii]
MVIVRGTDVVLAVGKELRMASLADVKARCRDDEPDSNDVVELGEYKTLNTPAITFEIQQLVLNSTSRLLSVVGAHSVVVVDLPRKGWANAVGKTLECRALTVGKFYHSLPGSPLVAQVLWHPWGEQSSSLLVLTTDSTLRDYTISEDVEEPAQTLSFAAKAEKKTGGGRGFGFSAEDQDASRAVAMAVGEGKGDWGPLTLYALMRNGDVVSLCPFLPKKASVPPSYVHSLSAFVSTKVDFLAASDAASDALSRFDPSASTTASFATPSKALAVSSRASTSHISSSSAAPTHTPASFSKRYNLQLQYVNSLVRQVSSSSARATAEDDSPALSFDEDEPVRIVAPSRADFTPALQGPFLLQPAPAELDNGAETRACDLAYVSYSASVSSGGGGEASQEEGPGIGVLAVAYSDGKVDLCLEVEKVEARWAAEQPSSRANGSVGAGAMVLSRSRRGGFGLNADEDESDGEHTDAEDLPTLAVYETIDLGLADELNPSGSEAGEEAVASGLADNHLTLVRDALYPDTLYAHHALGAHCLVLSPWLEALAAATHDEGNVEAEDETKRQREVEKSVKAAQGTEVLWVLKTLGSSDADAAPPVVAMQVVNDVYLGYSLLLLTSALQLVGIELSLRIDPSASGLDPSSSQPSSVANAISPSSAPAYVSLLDTPFTVPSLLARPRAGGVSALPRLAPTPGGSKDLSITPDTLRQLGKHVSTVQTSVRELVEAADEVQHRLELQMKELSRQLGKLAELKQLRADLGKSTSASAAGSTEKRLRQVEANQRALIERTDRVLQRLMEQHQPEISAYERKWFDELGRLEKQVHGGADGGGSSLEVRAERVQAMWDQLRPGVEELRRRELARTGREGTPRKGEMGAGQMKLLEGKLADEAKLISEAEKKVKRLTSALAATSLG